jgi:phosphoglycolate phosphatase-like HAD superfamily hydrolase
MERHLALLGAGDHIDLAICTAESTERSDNVVSAALQRLGVESTDGVLFFGDSLRDVAMARAAGVGAIGLLTGHFSRADLMTAGCRAVYRDPDELRDAMRITASADAVANEAA